MHYFLFSRSSKKYNSAEKETPANAKNAKAVQGAQAPATEKNKKVVVQTPEDCDDSDDEEGDGGEFSDEDYDTDDFDEDDDDEDDDEESDTDEPAPPSTGGGGSKRS
jgi:hypothetical protein